MSKQPDSVDDDFPIDELTFRKYYQSSTKEKLEWLENINEFVLETAPENTKEIRKTLREH